MNTTCFKEKRIKTIDSEIEAYIQAKGRRILYTDEVKKIIVKMYHKVTSQKIAEFLNAKYNTSDYMAKSIRCCYADLSIEEKS